MSKHGNSDDEYETEGLGNKKKVQILLQVTRFSGDETSVNKSIFVYFNPGEPPQQKRITTKLKLKTHGPQHLPYM